MIPAVEVEPNLRISFPHRSAEFVAGVRIGVLAAKMATGAPVFDSSVSVENMDQARELAAGMGYRAVVIGEVDGVVTLLITRWPVKPRLAVVASTIRNP